jgi:ubiquinone/menaquinone biosynthesis C-methylase UbiE
MNVQKLFDSVTDRYQKGWIQSDAGIGSYIHSVENWSIEQERPIGHNDFVLDIGAGGGRWTIAFAGRGARVIWMDISLNMAKIASQEIREARLNGQVNLVIADAQWLPFRDHVFDVAHNSEMIYYFKLKDRFQVLQESKRVCRSGGDVICSLMNNAAAPLWRLAKILRQWTGQDPYFVLEDRVTSFGLVKEFAQSGLRDVSFRGFVLFPPTEYWLFHLPGVRFWFPLFARAVKPIEQVLSRSILRYFGAVLVFKATVP